MTGITMPGLSGVRGHLAPSTAVFDDFDSPHTSRRPGSGRTLAEATGSLSRSGIVQAEQVAAGTASRQTGRRTSGYPVTGGANGLARLHFRQPGGRPRQGVHPWYADSGRRGAREPALDGGRILLCVLEMVYRPAARIEVPLTLVGWAMVLMLMVYATVQDVSRGVPRRAPGVRRSPRIAARTSMWASGCARGDRGPGAGARSVRRSRRCGRRHRPTPCDRHRARASRRPRRDAPIAARPSGRRHQSDRARARHHQSPPSRHQRPASSATRPIR